MTVRMLRGNRKELGLYRCDLKHPRIELFVDVIRKWSKLWGSTYQEVKALVLYHEEAHHLQHVNGLPMSEEDANSYALKKYIRTEGRKPSVPIAEWMRVSIQEEAHV